MVFSQTLVVGYILTKNCTYLFNYEKRLIIFLSIVIYFNVNSQPVVYEVYALRFGGPWFAKLSEIATGGSEKDSLEGCQMFCC